MVIFSRVLQKKGKRLSAAQLEAARGMTNLLISNREGAVYKGLENEGPILQPIGIVNKLKKKELLPHNCYVERVTFPGSSMKRCALYGVDYIDLTLRYFEIRDYIDSNLSKFPTVSDECLRLLGHMIALAYVKNPELIKEDAMLMGLSGALGEPPLFKALMSGASKGMIELLRLAAKSD